MKIHHCFFLLLVFGISQSCQDEERTTTLQITSPAKLDSVLNYFVDEDYYPFVYARLENLDGSLLYEHSSTNEDLLPNTEIDGDT